MPAVDREQMPPEVVLNGPALITESTGCIVLEPGWDAHVDAHGALLLQRGVGLPGQSARVCCGDRGVIPPSLHGDREQMGERLRRAVDP